MCRSVSATASPNFTLREELFQGIRTKDDLILIDLAVPRDIEPSVGKLQGVTLYDMDSFRIEEVPAELQMRRKQRRNNAKMIFMKISFWGGFYGK